MNILKTLTLKWWQVGLLKWSVLALGLAVGATWPAIFIPVLPLLWVLFALPAIYLTWVWWKQ